MKTKSIFIALFTFIFVSGMFAKNEKVVFSVSMDCISCQKKIEKNIAFEKGVKALDVQLEANTVAVTYDDSKTDIAKLQKGFKKIGYEAVEINAEACCKDKKEGECCKSKEKSATACTGTCEEGKKSAECAK
jgi:copper chaperone CopZ